MLASNGNIYGTMSEGGVHGFGTLFEYNPQSGVFTKKHDFNGEEGSHPEFARLLEINNPFLRIEEMAEGGLLVYPNPTSGKVYLEFETDSPIERIDVYDLTGRIVQQINQRISGVITFDLNQPNGVYLLSVIRKNGMSETIRIVKQ